MFPMWKGMSYRAIKIGKDKSSSFYGNNFFINKSHSSKTHNVFFLPWFASVHIYTHFIHLHCKSRRVTVSCLGERSEVKTAERGNVGPLGFRVCSDAGRHWRFGSPENQLEVPKSKRNSRDSRVCLFCVRSSMTLLPFSGWTSTSFSPFQNNILVFVCFRRTLLDFDISTILKWSSILVPCLLYSKHKKDRTHIYHYLSRIFTTYLLAEFLFGTFGSSMTIAGRPSPCWWRFVQLWRSWASADMKRRPSLRDTYAERWRWWDEIPGLVISYIAIKNGVLMGFNGDSMVIQWWFNGILMGYILW